MQLCNSAYELGNNCSLCNFPQLRSVAEHRVMNNEFKNEIFSSFDPNPVRACGLCGKKPALVRTMLNSHNGHTVRMFKCECGEQSWSEDKK